MNRYVATEHMNVPGAVLLMVKKTQAVKCRGH